MFFDVKGFLTFWDPKIGSKVIKNHLFRFCTKTFLGHLGCVGPSRACSERSLNRVRKRSYHAKDVLPHFLPPEKQTLTGEVKMSRRSEFGFVWFASFQKSSLFRKLLFLTFQVFFCLRSCFSCFWNKGNTAYLWDEGKERWKHFGK